MADIFEFQKECVNWINNKFSNGGSALVVGPFNEFWSGYLNNSIIIDAVENNVQTVAKSKTTPKYHKIINADIRGLLFNNYDLIILSDVINHMSVEDVQKMINYMRPRCREMLITVAWGNSQGSEIAGIPFNNKSIQKDLATETFLDRFPGFMPIYNDNNHSCYIKSQPAFSVIIPAHNEGTRIQTALLSIAEQTMKDYEVLVVCDNCTDDTEKKVLDFGFKTIVGKFGSAGAARNIGLDRACGEYILFLDADDRYLHAEAFSMMYWIAAQSKVADVIAFGFIFGYLGFSPVNGNGGAMFPNVWSKLWKRSSIGETRFEPLNFAEDELFCREIFTHGAQVARWDTPFVYYTYPRDGSLTDQHLKGIKTK
jgi:hypothetical protein